ncbi:uncharacterized protein LOC143071391 [Mytilus galloprovincialis]|uniref:uncharacterized protein LOC143071391 n=1 Tax=Mytilus galloprovincialis TaxID=29158 RepID=UPI003F7B642B
MIKKIFKNINQSDCVLQKTLVSDGKLKMEDEQTIFLGKKIANSDTDSDITVWDESDSDIIGPSPAQKVSSSPFPFVLSQVFGKRRRLKVPGFPSWYNIKYAGDLAIYTYKLLEDYKKGDLRIIV